jgi:hypothetical protein
VLMLPHVADQTQAAACRQESHNQDCPVLSVF